ncbi:DUF4145 domain-containing protein [Streptomyces sp. NPDC091201]|uniref:DUF4145 domain-containing protein n=1 Tax=Streptomyces sp. NPDC091201 TaxID=3155190 RepID=UPI003421E212
MTNFHRVGSNILVSCARCDERTMAEVEGELEDRNVEHGPPTLLQLARCAKCGQGVLAVEEDYGHGWDGEPLTVWPVTHNAISPLVPTALRQAHDEARKCFSIKAYTASAVMVRRTLEGVCKEQGVTKTPLMRALQELRDTEKIEGRLFDWAQALRTLGNHGAHFTDQAVTREDAADALALTEALLDYMYVLAARYEEFNKRRQQG